MDEVNPRTTENKENGSVDVTSPTSPASNSSLKLQDLNDIKSANVTKRNETEDEAEDDSSSEEESSDDESVDDPQLSDYERLRLRNIRRNEARLAQLGLLIPSVEGNDESQQSALTSALISAPIKKRGRIKGSTYKKRPKNLEPTRHLPRRHAKVQKFDPSFLRPEKTKRKYTRRSTNDEGYSSDDTVPASPITLCKIIKPQEHQTDFHDDKKFYLKKRRSRRGRPKREEYAYVCDEICCWCGGVWGSILDGAAEGKREVSLEDGKKVKPIDISLLDDDDAKLVRCKDCREAFHPGCMKLNGEEKLKVAAVQEEGKVEEIEAAQEFSSDDVAVAAKVTGSANDGQSIAEEHIDGAAYHSEPKPSEQQDIQENAKPRRCTRIPVRCLKCEAMRQLEIDPAAGNNANQDNHEDRSHEDVARPTKKVSAFKLDAIVDGNTILCTVDPKPALEADVNGKTLVCHVVFGGCGGENRMDEMLHESAGKKPSAAAKDGQKKKRNNALLSQETKDPVARKVEKLMAKAVDNIANASSQVSTIIDLRKRVDGPTSTLSVVRAGGLKIVVNAMENHPEVADIQSESIATLTEIIWYCQSLGINLIEEGCLESTTSAMERHTTHVEITKRGIELFRALSSFDIECCNVMFETDIVRVVISAMVRNPKELGVLTEASCFIQNMIVVSFDTVDILLKSKRGEESIVPLLVTAIQENQDCIGFVTAACNVLSNLSLVDNGVSKIIRCGGGQVLHGLFKRAHDNEVSQPAIQILYNLAYTSSSLLEQLVKSDCAVSVIAALSSSSKDPSHAAASFGLLNLLAEADHHVKKKVSDPSIITMALDAIKRYAKSAEVLESALPLLNSVDYGDEEKQLGLAVCKRVLDCMDSFPDEEAIQAHGCKTLFRVVSAQGDSRALRSLLHSTSAKATLTAVPFSCRDTVNKLLHEL